MQTSAKPRHLAPLVLLAVCLLAAWFLTHRGRRPQPRRLVVQLDAAQSLPARQYHWLEGETFTLGAGWGIGNTRSFGEQPPGDGWIFPYHDYVLLSPSGGSAAGSCEGTITVEEACELAVWVRAAVRVRIPNDTVSIHVGPATHTVTIDPGEEEHPLSWHQVGTVRLPAGSHTLRLTDTDGVSTAVDCLLLSDDTDFAPDVKFVNPASAGFVESTAIDLGHTGALLEWIEPRWDLPPGTKIAVEWATQDRPDFPGPLRWQPLDEPAGPGRRPELLPLSRFFRWRAHLMTRDGAVTPYLRGLTLGMVSLDDLGLVVRQYRNGRRATNTYPVRYLDSSSQQALELMVRCDLPEEVAGGKTELARMLRLREWTKARFPLGVPKPYPPWDARVVLDWVESGRTGAFCAQFAHVFVQCAAALGWPARYVGALSDETGKGHFVAEIWSNQYDKWVLMDPLYNVHYERKGIPLNALELHRAWLDARGEGVAVVRGERHFDDDPRIEDEAHRLIDCYGRFNLYLRSDHPVTPVTAEERDAEAAGGQAYSLNFLDDRTTRQERFGRLQSDRVEDFYWAINQTYLRIRSADADGLALVLDHNMPDFSHFEGDVDGHEKKVERRELRVPLGREGVRVELRAVNDAGVAGPASVLELGRP